MDVSCGGHDRLSQLRERSCDEALKVQCKVLLEFIVKLPIVYTLTGSRVVEGSFRRYNVEVCFINVLKCVCVVGRGNIP